MGCFVNLLKIQFLLTEVEDILSVLSDDNVVLGGQSIFKC